MSDRAVLDLARAAGLAVDWIDATGTPRQVGLASLRAILVALGYPASTRSEIADSWQRLQAVSILPAVATMQAGARLVVPCGSVDGDATAELQYEDGEVLPLRFAARERGLVGPPLDRTGYHRLRVGDRESLVAVAPGRCVTLAERGAGRHMWGVAAQIYALRRSGDGGIGDATSVRHLAESAARHGADAVALSPAHSLFAADLDRYAPYSPSSRLFLNPLFADPDVVLGEARVSAHRREAGGVEQLSLIDWRAAAAAKFDLLRRLFEDFEARDMPASTPLAVDFARFIEEGAEPLAGHAAFETLHAKWLAASPPRGNWRDWPVASIAELQQSEAASIRYHQFLQWVTARSFDAAQRAATGAGMRIGLIADLAIGMDHGGSHAWSYPSDLLLGLSVGAPPDDFNRLGQNWGLSGFSPHALRARGFGPFLATVRAAMRHAGGVRIDHVMGLQRLWLIPDGAPPSEGAYVAYPFDDLLRLLALESHRHGAVVIGEDLGTVPPGFRARLRRAGIAGMDVMWFERTRTTFRASTRWRADAVSMTTTHDLPTVAGWWRGADIDTRAALGLAQTGEEASRRHDRRRLWQAFRRTGVATGVRSPPSDAPTEAVDSALHFVASSPAPLMLAPVEDLLGLSDQPNLPGTIDTHPNWRRRHVPPAATLLDQPDAARRTALIARGRARSSA